MKKIFLTIFITISLLISTSVFALDNKIRIVGTMAGYGAVGGALLGTASLAFGASGSSVARGASRGLYAGLIFGGYMVASYEMKKRGYGEPKENYYPDSSGPYENQNSMNKLEILENYSLVANEIKKDPKKDPLVEINLLNYQF